MAQEFIFNEFPEMRAFMPTRNRVQRRLREGFERSIMRLLPHKWVHSFQAYEALEFFDVEDYIDMTSKLRTKKSTRQIMELCIRASEPSDSDWRNGVPIAILKALKRDNTHFDGKLYALTRSIECYDSERILELFCTEPAKTIQSAWRKYRERRRDQASRVIQRMALEWLYRPDGPMMKKSEASFYSIIARQ